MPHMYQVGPQWREHSKKGKQESAFFIFLVKSKEQSWWARSSVTLTLASHLWATQNLLLWRTSGQIKSTLCLIKQKWLNSVVIFINNATFAKNAFVGKIIYGVWPFSQTSGLSHAGSTCMYRIIVKSYTTVLYRYQPRKKTPLNSVRNCKYCTVPVQVYLSQIMSYFRNNKLLITLILSSSSSKSSCSSSASPSRCQSRT